MILSVSRIVKYMNKSENIIDITPVDIFQRNLFYYKINTNCSADYESLGHVGLLWDSFLSPLGVLGFHGHRHFCWHSCCPSRGFLGLFGLFFGPGVHGVMALGGLGGKVLKQAFVAMTKLLIGTGGVILSLFRPVMYGLVRLYACIRKTPRISIG